MSGPKETDLVTAVLLYAARCVAEGDEAALQDMGFGPEEIEALRTMALEDLHRAGELLTHCVDIRVDPQRFKTTLRHVSAERNSEALQHQLIEADAPLEMMHRLFGMASRDYTQLRRKLEVPSSVGRPRALDEQAANKLWQALAERLQAEPDRPLEPAEYLAVAEESDAPLRAVWNRVQRWTKHGQID